MSVHKDTCPKYERESVRHPVFHHSRPCWVCDAGARARYSRFMPMLPSLRAWIEGEAELERNEIEALYEYFFEDLDYGTQTGDTGTIDEWLADRPERVEDLIANIEGWCIEVAA